MTRKYTTVDVKTFVDLLRTDPDISLEKIAGMDMLVKTLDHFGSRTDADIEAEVIAFCRSAQK